MASPNIKSKPDDRQLLQPSCTYNCINPVHGNQIAAALTITECTDKALIYHMLNVCVHFSTSRDAGGRTALHVAASTGRTSLIEWLVKYRGAKLDQQDTESGYTPLHRSLYYGKLHTAVELMKMGANLVILDHDHLSPLELVMIDLFPHPCPFSAVKKGGELYIWGSNTNYTLGPSKSPTLPELLVEFHKEHPTYQVTAVCLEKYHCVITCDNVAFSWGHGLGGRLGLNSDSTVLTPRHIKINLKSWARKNQVEECLDSVNCDTCQLPISNLANHDNTGDESRPVTQNRKSVVVATARDHSIFLDAHDKVLTCGLNTHSVLGRCTEEKDKAALVPQPIPGFTTKSPLEGVSCGRYHSVAYNEYELFTWGLNGGQLGHGKEAGSYVSAPKRCVMLTASILDGDARIVCVVCSSGATAVVTSLNEVFLLHEFQCRKITSRLCQNIEQVALLGGQLANTTHESEKSLHFSESVSVKTEQHELIVAVLTDDGTVYIWRDSDPVLLKCTMDGGRSIIVRHLALNKRGIALVTSYGEVFTGVIKERRQRDKDTIKGAKKGKSGFLTDNVRVALNINKVPRIHRAIKIACDLDGENFIVIQDTQYRRKLIAEKQLPILNVISSDMALLLNDSSEDDLIHDFTFKIKGKLFYCHRFILAYAGKKMYDLVISSSNNFYEVNDTNVDVFEQLLQYIYTRSYDVSKIYVDDAENVIKTPEFSMNSMTDLDFQQYLVQLNLIEQLRNKLLLVGAIRYGVVDLIERLDINSNMGKTHQKRKSCRCKEFQGYNKDSYMGFSDVDIICKGNVILKAHKCVLIRAEYFKSLFSLRWNEKTNRTKITLDINSTYISLLLDFLYMDTISTQDYDTLLNLLSISDEFMIHGLKELCEYRLKQHINIRTVTNLFQYSFMYTSPTLQTYCMRFICDHLAELLELKTLEKLDETALKALSEFHCKKGKNRQINPVSFTIDIKDPPAEFNLATLEGLNYQTNENKPTVKRQRGPRKTSTKLSISEPDSELSTTVDSFSEVSQETDLDDNNGNNCKEESSAAIRVRAIAMATEKIKLTENNEEDFVNLSSSFLSNSSFDESFPDLTASVASPTGNTANFVQAKSAVKGEQRKVVGKLSQKARKRLLSEKDSPSTSTPVLPITNPWKLPDNTGDNLTTNIDKQEKEITHIVKEERTQKDNLIKMQNKLLSLTQIEDQAILYLEKFYNIDQVDDEIITVERVEVQNVAIPKWISKRLS